jgi:phosphatidylinositol alpha-mannosyltransferase
VAIPYRVSYAGTVAPVGLAPYSTRAIRRQIRTFRPDLLHVHEPFTPSTSMYATLASGGAPVVATFHAYLEGSKALRAATPLLRPVAKRISETIAVSQAAASFAAAGLGLLPQIIPNGVDVEMFAQAEPAGELPAAPRILWAHRLDPQKGLRFALGAFTSLAEKIEDLSLVVAGDGPDRGLFSSLSSSIRGRVIVLGNVRHENLPRYFAEANVFVGPATGQESFGVALVEAMAAGVPVVASDIAGYREVVKAGINGLLVEPGNSDALADAIGSVLADPGLAERLSNAGRERANEYSWETVTGRIETVYEQALSR